MSHKLYCAFFAIIALNTLIPCEGAVTFKEISKTAYKNDPVIPITRDYGIKAVVSDAITTKRVSNSTFTVKVINHIYNGTDGSYVDYKFDLSLNNPAGDIISANFTVQYQSKTKKNLLLAMNYNVTYGKYANQTNPNNSTNTTTPTNNTTKPSNTSNPATPNNNTNQTKPNNSTNTTLPANNTNPANTPNTTNSTNSSAPFTPIPESNFNQTLLQSLANNGTQFVAAKAIARGDIPDGQYILTHIYTIAKQELASGTTNYQFDLEFAKTDGSRVLETNFTIQYVPKVGSMTIIAYAYNVLPFGV